MGVCACESERDCARVCVYFYEYLFGTSAANDSVYERCQTNAYKHSVYCGR